jgi:class 3 adenylate cyclase/DNA-binding winged helix-turn-helix (wHTH) protein
MTTYALGPFRLDTQHDLLFRGAEPVALGRRATALLRALLERPGAVVLKEVLIEAAWPGQAVEDSNLTVQIAALRRVLAGVPGGDCWIETMPRRGYRFTGPVATETENGGMPPFTAIEPPGGPGPTPHHDAERRQITALSCELVGAARAHGTDLEDLREAVGKFQRCVSETAGRHEGFVYRRLGKNVLALFGYPFAHEHDVEQAVRAGLELCAAVGALTSGPGGPMRCRVGIATGMVIAGERARDGEGPDCEIIGDTPDLAALLRISAQPGAVVIDQVTRKLIGNLFDCRDLDTIETDGGGEPVRRWQMLGESVASRFEATRGLALIPLIGRDEEIDLLLRRWARAKARVGQVVLISGEPGIGKSRLAVAFAERLQTEPLCCLRYYCSPHHQNSALFPFIDQLCRASGFARDDPPTIKLEKLGTLLSHAEPPDEDVALLTNLLSLAASERHAPPNLSPKRKKELTVEALIRRLEGLARRSPLLIIFEDAQWIDPTSRELLDLVVNRLRTLPVLLIVTFRPEFQAPWTGHSQVTLLALSRLDRRDRTALITRIAGDKALPDEVVIQIADRTDGVPLFVEELTKSVLESGQLREEADCYVLDGALPTLAIPTSLHASLMARLDRSVSGRRVAQIGAAIGREFGYALLCDLGGLAEHELQAALAQLVASELVFQRGTPPDALYTFKHALVQDAAHGSLLRDARQQLHAQIAEALESQCPELMDAQPELLAQHCTAAGLVEKSVTYWGKAGHRSVTRSAMAEAAAQFQRALDQLALLPTNITRKREELELLSALGGVLLAVKGMAAPEMHAILTRARELWDQLGSPSEFLQIPYGQSRYHAYRGELDLALRIDEDLIRLSRAEGLITCVFGSVARACEIAGQHEEALTAQARTGSQRS